LIPNILPTAEMKCDEICCIIANQEIIISDEEGIEGTKCFFWNIGELTKE
jgi:hypothetical protein